MAATFIGLAGFFINKLDINLGWGLHFVFGNAAVYAFIRILRPTLLPFAIGISSLESIVLWGHPWAWCVWVLEAVVLACWREKAAPIRVDVLYWILLGAPLLALTYGGLMGVDRVSVLLVVAKQATNGIFNVVIGEMLFIGTAAILPRFGRGYALPQMTIEAFLFMLLMSIVVIPLTAFFAIDAPIREEGSRRSVERLLDSRLQVMATTLLMWKDSRSLLLQSYSAQAQPQGLIAPGASALSSNFERIQFLDQPNDIMNADIFENYPPLSLKNIRSEIFRQSVERTGISFLFDVGFPGQIGAALFVPSPVPDGRAVLATIRTTSLAPIAAQLRAQGIEGAYLIGPGGRVLTVQPGSEIVDRLAKSFTPQQIIAAGTEGLLIKVEDSAPLVQKYGSAVLFRAQTIEQMPGWTVIAGAQIGADVIEGRSEQVKLYGLACVFILIISVSAYLLSKRVETSLRRLAQSAAELAMLGERPARIDGLVIRELSDISGNIAAVGSRVANERGALVSYQRRLQSIARHAPMVVYAADVTDGRRGRVLYVSETAERLLGYKASDIARSKWWLRVVHPEDRDGYIAVFSDLKPCQAVSLEYRIKRKNGEYLWVFDSLSVEDDPFSGRAEAVGLIMDISERKAASAQLIQADKMASLGRMAAGMAHELNQPLNFIKMAATNLREQVRADAISSPVLGAKLERMINHVNRASEIILQMRVFGRVPTDLPYPMPIVDAVMSAVGMLKPQLTGSGIEIELLCADPLLKVRALPVLIEQVVLNLLLNARDSIHARQAGGRGHSGVIKIAIQKKRRRVEVVIEDNGTGLSDAVLRELFVPFFTTKSPKDGTGLGLSISYGIVRDLRGNLTAENTGEGAKFTIDLPQVI